MKRCITALVLTLILFVMASCGSASSPPTANGQNQAPLQATSSPSAHTPAPVEEYAPSDDLEAFLADINCEAQTSYSAYQVYLINDRYTFTIQYDKSSGRQQISFHDKDMMAGGAAALETLYQPPPYELQEVNGEYQLISISDEAKAACKQMLAAAGR